MKMNLKNRTSKKIKLKRFRLTSKNLFLFLVSFSVVTIIIGIIFYFFLNTNDKNLANNHVLEYFTIKDNYNYLTALKDSLLENTFNIFLIWILGISVIGVIATVFIYFLEMFSIGFFLASIFGEFGAKGLIGAFCYLFPSKIGYLIVFFLLTFFAIKISSKIIKLCFTKEEINLKEEIRKYFKVLLFSFLVIIVISIMEVFIDPFLIKLFTKL